MQITKKKKLQKKKNVVTNVACINLHWYGGKEVCFSLFVFLFIFFIFIFSNQEKEAFSGISWTLSPLEDKMSLN